jgi:hypothetical protein
MSKILREIFSGANGKLSAKRVIGGIAMAVALTCTTILVFRDGSNDVVENLLMTIFITSVSLLGLPAVTGIWKNSKVEVGESKSDEDAVIPQSEPEQEIITDKAVPPCKQCLKCIHYNEKGTE